MAQSSSQAPRSSHITAKDNFISDGAYPTDQDHAKYPKAFDVAQDTGYCSGEQHAAALLTISGETHLVQGAPDFLKTPAVSHQPARPPVHARSLAPAIITAVCSAFPDTGFMEYKGLANEITELINNREKESCLRLTQQERWIEGLQNHVRELYAHIEATKRALQGISAALEIHGLTPPGSTTVPHPLTEPFGLHQSTAVEVTPPSCIFPQPYV